MTTSIIPRPPEAPPVRVLEVDGPRRSRPPSKYSYRAVTSNDPICDYNVHGLTYITPDPRLKDWGEPHWFIQLSHSGHVKVHACRPTLEEFEEGEGFGALSSVICVDKPDRTGMRNALRLARILTRISPGLTLAMRYHELEGIGPIESPVEIHPIGTFF